MRASAGPLPPHQLQHDRSHLQQRFAAPTAIGCWAAGGCGREHLAACREFVARPLVHLQPQMIGALSAAGHDTSGGGAQMRSWSGLPRNMSLLPILMLNCAAWNKHVCSAVLWYLASATLRRLDPHHTRLSGRSIIILCCMLPSIPLLTLPQFQKRREVPTILSL